MNKRTKRIVEKIYELNENLTALCNYGASLGKEVVGKKCYIYNGNVYYTKKELNQAVNNDVIDFQYDLEGKIMFRDYRDYANMHQDIPHYAVALIGYEIKKCYFEFTNEEFSLFVGAAVNLYYLAGLHTCIGDFDVSMITQYVIEERLRKYIRILCECIRVRTFIFAQKVYEKIEQTLDLLPIRGEPVSESLLDERYLVYIQDIKYYEKHKDNEIKKLTELHEELIKIEPRYRIGQIYMCISDIKRAYAQESVRKGYLKYAGILGIDLYNHVVGTPKLFDVTFILRNGKLEVDTDFEDGFGICIPYIQIEDALMCNTEMGEYIAITPEMKNQLLHELDAEMKKDSQFDSLFDEEEQYIYTYTDVRKEMEPYLGLGEKVSRAIMKEYVQGKESTHVMEYDGMSFKDYFQMLVYESGRSEREIAMTVGFNGTYTNSIINGKVKTPTTNALLAFAISLKLSLEQTQKLLSKAGRCISERNDNESKKERMLIDYICNQIYDIVRINSELDAAGLTILADK